MPRVEIFIAIFCMVFPFVVLMFAFADLFFRRDDK